METLNMARHCTTRPIIDTYTLEMLSSDPENPQYFWPPPVPYPLLHCRPDDADLELPDPHPQVAQHMSAPDSPSQRRGLRISELLETPGSVQPGAHSLGSEPRIGRRAARRYRVGVAEWTLQAQRRWDLP